VSPDGSFRPGLVDVHGQPADPGQHGTYILPPGAVARARQEAEEVPGPTMTDELAKESTPPPSYPAGCPEFTPLTSLDFEQRATAFELLDEVQEIGSDLPKQGAQVSAKQAAKMYRVLAKMDKLLLHVAKDKQAYEGWPGRHDDVQFGQAWTAYQAGAQPGEAASSSS
jgi:hypothetical protein